MATRVLVVEDEEQTAALLRDLLREFGYEPLLVQGMSEMHGTKSYPDANRTLRFTYGEVKGYVPHDAAVYQPFTNLSGVIEKDIGREPFDTPEKLKQLYRAHDFGPYATPDGQNVPVDFLSTTDIIGGNSGSPLINARGEVIGAIFDGNIHSLGGEYFFDPKVNRAVSVSTAAMTEALTKVYGRNALVAELTAP